jgi:hypothetical protein
MKNRKWVAILLIVLFLGILVAASLLEERFMQSFKFPFNWGNGQLQSDHPFLERPAMLVSSIGTLITLCIIGILSIYMIPDRIRYIADSLPNKLTGIFRLMFMGFLIGILVIATGISSALMFVTFPLTILLLVSLFIIGFMGFVSLAFAVGRSLLKQTGWVRTSPLFALVVGMVILFALVRVPLLGAVLFLMISSLGLGATIVSHFGSGKSWDLHSLMEAETNEEIN